MLLAVALTTWGRDMLHYRRYGISDGLPQRMVPSIVQDTLGYIWLGTWDGLCRFDGYHFEPYNQDAKGKRLGRIVKVRLADDGRLYVVSDRAEAFLFDPVTLAAEPAPDSVALRPHVNIPSECLSISKAGLSIVHGTDTFCVPPQRDALRRPRRYEAFRDRQDVIWTSFDNALYALYFSPAPFSNNDTLGGHIRAIALLRDGTLLMGGKFSGHNNNNSRLLRLDRAGRVLDYVDKNGMLSDAPTDFGPMVYSIQQDRLGRVWMGTRGRGLYCWNPDATTDEERLLHFTAENSDLASNNIFSLLITTGDRLWIGTWGKGVQLANVTTDEVRFLTPGEDGGRVRSLCAVPAIHKCMDTDNDQLVAATHEGLCYYDMESGERLTSIGDMDFSCLLPTASGHLLAATIGLGLYEVTTTQDVIPVEIPEVYDLCYGMAETSPGCLWFVGDNEVVRYDEASGFSERLSSSEFNGGVAFSENACIQLDSMLWVGTQRGFLRLDLSVPFSHVPQLDLLLPPVVADTDNRWRNVITLLVCLILIILQVQIYSSYRRQQVQRQQRLNLVPSTPNFTPVEELFISRLTQVIEQGISDPEFTIDDMASQMGMSRSILYDQCRQAAHTTPASLLQEIRLKRAMQLLASGQYRVGEVSYMVGFTEPKYFARVFHRMVGMTPARYISTHTQTEEEE